MRSWMIPLMRTADKKQASHEGYEHSSTAVVSPDWSLL